jgi:hypothetical protein
MQLPIPNVAMVPPHPTPALEQSAKHSKVYPDGIFGGE